MNEIICGDCVDVLKKMKPDSVDLTVTSPPYDEIRDYGGYEFNFEEISRQLYHVTKPGGWVIWIVADQTKDYNESGTSFRQALHFQSLGFLLNDTIIYQRQARPGKFPRYPQSHEYMFTLCKGVPKTMNLQKSHQTYPTKTSFARREKDGHFSHRKYYATNAVLWTNVWDYGVTNSPGKKEDSLKYKHPATFPDALARDHIISWSNEGDLVLDPMCGSGTVPKMAKLLKRNYIGIDISSEYCVISRKRVEQESIL